MIENYAPSSDSFDVLLEDFFKKKPISEGAVLNGKIIAIEKDFVFVDVGLKAAGRIPLREFIKPQRLSGDGDDAESPPSFVVEAAVGDSVDVLLKRIEGRPGEPILSFEEAKQEIAWNKIHALFTEKSQVEGTITRSVDKGFLVDIYGLSAFLHANHAYIQPNKEAAQLIGTTHKFEIYRMEKARRNVVVSLRSGSDKNREAEKAAFVESLYVGQELMGTVKNILSYGAFVDLGVVDGLLYLKEISWRRINDPSEVLTIGQRVKVKVTKIAPPSRISLGMKYFEADPWLDVAEKFPVGTRLRTRITNVVHYGAFAEVAPGVEGLIHYTEISWGAKLVPPSQQVSTSQEVDVVVLDVDAKERRISLSMKRCMDNPWDSLETQYPVGTELEREIKNVTRDGFFVNILDGIDGMVRKNDLSWDKNPDDALATYTKGQRVRLKVLHILPEEERMSLGVKQVSGDEAPKVEYKAVPYKRGDIVTGHIAAISDTGLDIKLDDDLKGFVRRSDSAKDKHAQDPSKFSVGQEIEGKVTSIDVHGVTNISIRSYEIDEERRLISAYAPQGSGAGLEKILGQAIDLSKIKKK